MFEGAVPAFEWGLIKGRRWDFSSVLSRLFACTQHTVKWKSKWNSKWNEERKNKEEVEKMKVLIQEEEVQENDATALIAGVLLSFL